MDRFRSIEAEKRQILEGNVRLRHRDTTFTADRIDVTMEGQEPTIAVATGSPRATDPRSTITGERFTIYLKERRVVVEGGFKVVTRPKEKGPASGGAAGGQGDGGTGRRGDGATAKEAGTQKPLRDQLKGETTITGQKLEYDYRRKNVAAEGSLKVLNRGRTVTAQRLNYTDRTEDLIIEGDAVRWEDEKGQHWTARGPIKINLAEGRETIEVNQPLTGKFLVTESEEDEEQAKPAAPSPAPREPR
jgi:lipopolysaccharide export system protein LptA